MSVVHSTFSDFDHLSGRLELATAGLEEGPRKEGHSGSAAKAIEIAKMVERARVMILLDDRRQANLSVYTTNLSFSD